jgi:two-component system cell cycle sensor histidine kinase/response regulator CckA
MNLITNASEAIGQKPGKITLTTGVAELDAEELAQSRVGDAPPSGRYVFLEVTDTGIGMDDETQRRLFEPFFTTKFQGRGLGMAAVLGIVRGHHGALLVRSAPGRGTAVKVLFPAPAGSGRPEGEGPVASGQARVPRPATLRGTVLLVEDERAVLVVVKELLEHLGLSVMTASDGEEGVRVFGEHAAQVDCVLLDLSMPRMDGLGALREITRIKPGVKVILASGFARQEALERFAGQGLAAFIQKPYGAAELRETLSAVLVPAGGDK